MRSCCAATAAAVTTSLGTVTVVDCGQCDRGHCSRCKTVIPDAKARHCRACGAPIVFPEVGSK